MIRRQFGRYVIAGSAAVGIHFAILILLVELFSANPTIATGVGFLCACMANYLMQRAWVFEAAGAHSVLLPRYVLVTTGTLTLNLLLFWLAHQVVGLWYPVAQFLVYGAIFLVNFIINRQYTFRRLRTPFP